MSPRGIRTPLQRTYVFDSEALSRAVRGDKELKQIIKIAPELGIRIATSALTTLEAFDPRRGAQHPLWDWSLSRITVVHTSDPIVRTARRLLADAGLHGHKYAIDAVLAAVALAETANSDQVALFTSDNDDMEKLLGDSTTVLIEPLG
ncbi:PIN domain-containing protein [Streptomyces sp. TRM68367]|uniref:PIN domain-containing protein n=1 Tax=Streptomyces sp. TRM68367 TaxID=2758415 RepID=UPI00165BA055|nr:PIN domain-containing protein [Streptomyces sp. TRM68367]MBC9727526.1 PIN domain-containing protein [Streptomyces sp. TRM68367]